ncbi:hypothetical protein B484DRAFT_425846, partial [Ochromonadaceae sp. CCMP2298]
MCAAHEGAKPPTRGKVPARAEYVVDDEGTGTATAGAGTEGTAGAGTGAGTKAGAGTAAGRRRLARIIPQGPDACIDSGLATGYLNRAEVMRAIHVKDPGYCWSVCGTAAGWSYQSTRTNLPRDTYPGLIAGSDESYPGQCLIPKALSITLYTMHYALYTIHYTLYTIHYALYTIHYTLYTIHYTLYTIHYTLYTMHYTLYTKHYTLYTSYYTLYTIHYTLYTIHYTLYTIHYT